MRQALFFYVFFEIGIQFLPSNVPVTVVEQQFRKRGLDLQDKCCCIGVGNFFEKVLPFLAQKRAVEG